MNLDSLKQRPELGLFLGLFVGDGGLSFKHNGEGYRIYPISFYNTNIDLVELFHSLFFNLFNIKGNIRSRDRKNKLKLWEFEKYSKDIYAILNQEFEIPYGKKALNVKIPSFILSSSDEIKKNFF